jgi:hypothetical protein
MRNGEILAVFFVGAAMMIGASLALGQGVPSPGPTKPSPPSADKPKKDIVINPTEEECRTGWNPSHSLTKEEFESFCAKMKAAR